MTPEEMKAVIKARAAALKAQGWSVDLHTTYGAVVAVNNPLQDRPFFASGEFASELMEDAEDAAKTFGVSEEEWLLYHLDSAGALL